MVISIYTFIFVFLIVRSISNWWVRQATLQSQELEARIIAGHLAKQIPAPAPLMTIPAAQNIDYGCVYQAMPMPQVAMSFPYNPAGFGGYYGMPGQQNAPGTIQDYETLTHSRRAARRSSLVARSRASLPLPPPPSALASAEEEAC